MTTFFSIENFLTVASCLLASGIGYGVLKQKVSHLENEIEKMESLVIPFGERIARLEERSRDILEILKEVRDFHLRK